MAQASATMINPDRFMGKSVMVTGGGGSIGLAICEALIRANVLRRLILVSLSESALYNGLRHLRSFGGDTVLTPLLGHCRDPRIGHRYLPHMDVVIHAAAHKHLPLCEGDPLAAIDNNALATWDLACMAVEHGVPEFVAISTDKAVAPTSVLGATKRLAELLLRDRACNSGTVFRVVRFGNVLDSAGSVLPLWREQIAAGGPLTITDRRCTRYFMTVQDAVALVLGAMEADTCGGLYVLDMGERRAIGDLARELMKEMGRTVKIKEIGLRPGEKLHEEITAAAVVHPTAQPRVLRVAEAATPITIANYTDLRRAVERNDAEAALKLLWAMIGEG